MKRIMYFDMAKALLIIAVVLGHFADQLTKESGVCRSLFLFLYAFHMPAFLYIAGLFYKNEKTIRRTVSFLVLYVLLKGLIYAAKWAVNGKAAFDLFSEGGTPWFLLAMALYTFLTRLIPAKWRLSFLILNVIGALAAGYCDQIGEWMALSRLIVFYPFFLAGVMSGREKLQRAAGRIPMKILGSVILLAWGYIAFVYIDRIYFLRHLFTGSVPYHASVMPYGFLYRLLVYTTEVLTGISFLMLVPGGGSRWLSDVGRYTLPIYFFHRPFLYILTGIGVHTVLITSLGMTGIIVWLLLSIATVFLFARGFFDRFLRLFL